MKEKSITTITILVRAILFLILGLVLVFIPSTSLAFFHFLVTIGCSIFFLISFISELKKKKNIINKFLYLIMFFISLFFIFNRTFFLSLFPIIFSFYLILLGTTKLSTFIVYKMNNFSGFTRMFLDAISNFIIALLIITRPTKSIDPLTFLLGIYFILVSFNQFIDLIKEHFPNNFLVKKRKFRITMPIIISLFVPYAIYTKLNKRLSEEVTSIDIDKKVSGNVDLEIFIGVKESNIGKFGHADLYFDNKIYSYGHYDEDSKKLFDTIGDGILFIIDDRMKYLRFCAEHSKKTIFAFGITLTNEQKKNVRKVLKELQSKTYRWKCIQETNKKEEYGDYASCLYRATKAKFYKFNSSTYKLYFALWTNCVKLVDDVLKASGGDILRLNGVITPGAYYYHLNNEYKKKNSNVIRKEIITNKDIFTQNKK